MLVLAGPGSGKTFVMVQRILNLIQEKHIHPENILVISFSKASTLELKQRFKKQFKEQIIEPIYKEFQDKQFNYDNQSISNLAINGEKVNFSTFHACFFHILKETYHYTSKDIISEKQKRDLIKTVLSNPKCDEEKIEDYLKKISYYKNKEKKELQEKEAKEFQQIFYDYNQEMHFLHKLDFDDMGLLCLQLFKIKPEILNKWQEKFQYILIDEFQDINMVQFRIIQLLADKYKNIFVVGDDDQSIYGFRGANPQIMLDFKKYYPNTSKVLLETNYRCSEEIVKEALKVIEKNKIRFQKEIVAFHRSIDKNDRRDEVKYNGFENEQKEYFYIGERIKNLIIKAKFTYSDIACIFRTNQDMTGLAEYFARHKIPFVMKESCNSIFQHFIAKDILAYLQFFLEGKKRNDFLRIMNKPLRYLSRNAFSDNTNNIINWNNLKKHYAKKTYMLPIIEQLEKHEKWILKMDLFGAVQYIRKVVGYEQYLKEFVKEQGGNLEEFKEILDFVHESIRNMRSIEEWRQHISIYEEAIKNTDDKKEGVQMITMHACKGLEYPIVFLPDCNEGKIPHKKAVTTEEIEEERRMFYVAMTRAKEHLEILYIEDKLKKHLQKSRFVNV
ncbi:MAG: ATP-dependent helicase [Lachnospiraceae bacterium]|nr:ATP-dependent helicase [Lachnospiraceae bacterium]